MKSGDKDFLSGRGARPGEGAGSSDAQEQRDVMDHGVEEFTSDELREFLEADGLDVGADPVFKERLRRRLWRLVRERLGLPPEDHELD
jgi:hypothetical protein